MRHLLVTNDFPPKVGGIQSYLWELWRRLPAADVTVMTTPYSGDEAWDAAQPFRVVRTPERVLLPRQALVSRIDALADDVGADLVLLDPALPLGLVGPHLRHRYGVVLHGAEVTVPGRAPGLHLALRRVLDRAVVVIAAGGYPLAEAERAAGHELPAVIVPPGVDVDRFHPLDAAARHAARAELGLPADAEVVLGLSRLVPRKGFDVLLRAAGRLGRRRPDLVVAIGGGGRDRSRLERIARETGAPARFLGRVCEELLPAAYGSADVFAMLCRNRWAGLEQEGFGIVFVEAAACGVAQIAGDSGGSAEAVDDGTTGFVLRDPRDDVALEWLLDRVLDDPGRLTALGAAARSRAEREFSYDVLTRRLRQAIEDSGVVQGQAIIRASWIGTGVFTVTAVAATIAPDTLGPVNVVVSLALFFIGCVLFLLAFGRAVSRTTDAIGIGGLYFLAGSAPRRVQVHLLTSLGVETVVAIASASIRPFTNLAFGVLVPVYGLGLCGLWASRYGTFEARTAE